MGPQGEDGCQGPPGQAGPTGPMGPAGPSNLLNLIDGETDGSVVGVNTGGGCDGENDNPPGEDAVQINTDTVASGDSSFAIGIGTVASGTAAFSQGQCTLASGTYAVAEGRYTIAAGNNSHAEGSLTIAYGADSHAEGQLTNATGTADHAEGSNTIASGSYSHAEGYLSIASGYVSHAEGYTSIASGYYSHAANSHTVAQGYCQTAIGSYNVPQGSAANRTNNDSALIIGNGGSSAHSNAFRFTWGGNGYAAGAFSGGGADYAEMFEWIDGNPDNQDRRGYFVTLQDGKIRKANKDEYILGVISATPAILGDAQGTGWYGMYVRDKFGEIIYEEMDEKRDVVGENSEITTENVRISIPKINSNYDAEKEYISRDMRKEWAAVGMLGKLIVRDDGSCKPNGCCAVSADGMATASDNGYFVLNRIDEDLIRIIVK